MLAATITTRSPGRRPFTVRASAKTGDPVDQFKSPHGAEMVAVVEEVEIAEALPQQVWVVDHTRRDQRGVRRDMPFHGGGEDRHDPASRRAFSVSRCRM